MLTSALALIQRLKARNAERKLATECGARPAKPVSPATLKNVRIVERAIGFRLPALLRAIYLKVGNGGFGRVYGIVGTGSLKSCYREMLKLEKENAVWRWPQRLLPLANYGCGMWSCVDCEYERLPMILWDPVNLDEELEGSEARLIWGNAFWDQGKSFKRWWEDWLAGKEERDPRWPSDAWMKKRLGFILPK
jgi:hypothetical protein